MKKAELSHKQEMTLIRLDNALNGEALKRHSGLLNDEGIAHYEKGELEDAIIAFDQATHYEQASISVLLNSIQAKVSLMERDSPDKQHLKDVRTLLIRIGELGKDDERFVRYSRLRKTYDRLCRAVEK